MKAKVLSYAVISLILLNIWTLYMFFDYFNEKETMFHSLGLFFNFVNSLVYALGLGGILLIIRLVFYLKNKTNPLKSNFFYILCAIFNLNFFVIWLICVILKILEINKEALAILAIGSFIISSFIISDVYKSCFRLKKD